MLTKYEHNFLQNLLSDFNSFHFPSFSQLKTMTKELEDKFVISLEMPGFSKEDISISIDNKLLTVSAERKKESTSDNEKIHLNEFSYGLFKRSFNLPSNFNNEDINASFLNGILSIDLPKKEISEVKKIEIK
jgi:HSP20 family protein